MEFQELVQEAAKRMLTLDDIALYCAASKLPMGERLDGCALELARQYAAGRVDFEAGDNLVNVLFGFASQHVEIPDLLFAVFLAFDAGEFYPDEIRSPSPEERFTRPQINAALAEYDRA
ncbi:hypothetical protein [Duganella phyllosphaerae]|uniref:hypothetical protein n=1 Tax=Duganella phyllosphaerae TaxID=762836 RepID=UPI00087480E8|nr:hypothetical protein [Duganella phyllosphaerae]